MDFCDCEPDCDEGTHFLRSCTSCGTDWYSTHCPHDGVQGRCPHCDKRPEPKPVRKGLIDDA